MKRFFPVLSLLFICIVLHAQDNVRRPLQGKISIGEVSADINEISVKNLQSKESVSTTNGGFFTLLARAGDTLIFSGNTVISMKMKLAATDISKEILPIVLTPNGTQLQEVNVDKKITSKSLGINPKTQKAYTPAERKLATARKVSPQRKADQTYVAVGTDPLINAVSGRSKDLKKQAQVEKKESSKAQLTELYDRTYFTDTLKIPNDYVDGFLYYVIEDKRFVKTLDSGNKEQTEYQLTALATEYKKTLKSEAK
jgi:hypothetical protein